VEEREKKGAAVRGFYTDVAATALERRRRAREFPGIARDVDG